MIKRRNSLGYILLTGAAMLLLGASSRASVSVAPLPGLSVETMGVKTELPANLWKGMEEKRFRSLMTDLTRRPLTPALRRVVTEALATDGGRASAPMSAFLDARLEALLALGEAETVLDMIDQIPENELTKTRRLRRLDALSQLGQYDQILEIVSENPEDGTDVYRINALVALGRMTEAELFFDVLMENKEADSALVTLGNRIFRSGSESIPAAETDVWATGALRVAAKTGFPPKDKRTRGVWRLLVSLENAPLTERLSGAEQLGDMAFIARADLKKENPQLPMIKRAKEWQAFVQSKKLESKAQHLKKWAVSAQKDGVFVSAAEAVAKAASALPAEKDTVAAAETLVTAAALTDNMTLAGLWFPLLSEDKQMQMSVWTHQLGMVSPVISAEKIQACVQKTTPACAVFMRQVPTYFPVGTSAVFDLKPLTEGAYPAVVSAALEEQRLEGKTGALLLEGVRLLAASSNRETDVLKQLAYVIPGSWARAIQMERLIIDGYRTD